MRMFSRSILGTAAGAVAVYAAWWVVASAAGLADPARPGEGLEKVPAKVEAAAAAKPPRRFTGLGSVRIGAVPHVQQKPDFCGEACAAMYLAKLGQAIDQDEVFNRAGLDPEAARGCHTPELATALTAIGFRIGPVWYRVPADGVEAMEQAFRGLHADLAAGVPSILCMRYDSDPEAPEHFRLVLGYDAATDEILYHEPAVAGGAYRRMSGDELLKLWPLKYDSDRWTLIRLRLEPGTMRQAPAPAGFTDADYAQQAIRLKRMAPEDFSLVVQRPFVVLGDDSIDDLRRHAQGTIRWAVEHLKAAYFSRDPDHILAIWLFKDRASYDKHTESIFGSPPHTPFGYYSHADKALIMNIGTGTGTLVHEIVHPFMASNFPACPAWFNEGLASLYEQCGTYRGRIWGYTNWRLAGLQEAIQPPEEPEEAEQAEDPELVASSEAVGDGGRDRPPAAAAGETSPADKPLPPELPTFKTLCHTSSYEFYSRDPGTNYAQARYLCYYLQQRGLLGEFYRRFRAGAGRDPSGYETLKAVLGVEDEAAMREFEQSWKDWVMTLRFP